MTPTDIQPYNPPTPPQQAQDKRKRGGQPGNTNAAKHGLYSRNFRSVELDDLPAAMAQDLTEEIAMLRIVMARVLALAAESEDLPTTAALLGSLGHASTQLSGLLKTQRLISGDGNTTAAAITAAIAEVVNELCLA
jgi:hypothetical protein